MKTPVAMLIAALLSLLLIVAPAGAAAPGEVARFELPASRAKFCAPDREIGAILAPRRV